MKKGGAVLLVAVVSLVFLALAGTGVWCLASRTLSDESEVLEENDSKENDSKENDSKEDQGLTLSYRIVDGEQASQEDIIDTIMKLQKRAENYCDNAIVYQTDADVICVDLPEVRDPEYITKQMGRNGSIYFIAQTDSRGNENYSGQSIADENGVVQWGYGLNFSVEELAAKGSVVLEGADIASAKAVASRDAMGITSYVVQLDMTTEGTEKFAAATERAWEKGETIAIYFDGEILSVPGVSGKITDGRAIITSLSNMEEAEAIALAIDIGSLKLELEQL